MIQHSIWSKHRCIRKIDLNYKNLIPLLGAYIKISHDKLGGYFGRSLGNVSEYSNMYGQVVALNKTIFHNDCYCYDQLLLGYISHSERDVIDPMGNMIMALRYMPKVSAFVWLCFNKEVHRDTCEDFEYDIILSSEVDIMHLERKFICGAIR